MYNYPVTYIAGLINNPDEVFDSLWNDLNWERREATPRREYWTNIFDRDYTYGSEPRRRTYRSQKSHDCIDTIRAGLADYLGFNYEGCFLNGYETNQDWLSWHADDDPGINHARPIAIITVGNGREIGLMNKATGTKVRKLLEPGSLMLMHAGMQSTHLHCIHKAGYVVKRPRISLTYRSLI